MPQEKIDALSIELSTIANDTSNFNDENKVEHKLDASKSYTKISKLEELRTSYRKKTQRIKDLKWNIVWRFSRGKYQEDVNVV